MRSRFPSAIGVDGKSFQKRYENVAVINDLDGNVLHVADGRGKASLGEVYQQFDDEQLAVLGLRRGRARILPYYAEHQVAPIVRRSFVQKF